MVSKIKAEVRLHRKENWTKVLMCCEAVIENVKYPLLQTKLTPQILERQKTGHQFVWQPQPQPERPQTAGTSGLQELYVVCPGPDITGSY